MQFNETWLKSLVDTPLQAEVVGDILTMAGLELEELRPFAPAFSQVVVGRVLSKTKHPDADRLNVCMVDVGEPEPRQIVCGASNVAEGICVPCALPGAVLPGGISIKVGRMRGVESAGMLCAGQELGIASDVDGLLILPEDTQVGACVRKVLNLDEPVFTFKITPNRADCLSVQGIARELHALTSAPLLVAPCVAIPPSLSDTYPVDVLVSKVCGRFVGRVLRGINNQVPTPAWMLRRLEAAGQRSINALVDISNYVMLEWGQPSHCFDLSTLQGPLVVRLAKEGECLTVLSGQELVLAADVAVVADAQGPQALAGIMGGQASAVQPNTQDVFLEAAFWWPDAIAGRARALNVSSEAAYRFERGVDFSATVVAVERITHLILDICGGQAGPVHDQTFGLPNLDLPNSDLPHLELPERQPICLRHERAEQLVGMSFEPVQVEAVLSRLGCKVRTGSEQNKTYWVTPPAYRFDLSIEEDLVEELIRVVGYDQLPLRPTHGTLKILPVPETRHSWRTIRHRVAALGYQEVLTYSFTPEAWELELHGNADPIRLQNPIASHLGVMRSGLMGSLLQVLRHNLAHRVDRLRVFELACTFVRDNTVQDGPQTVAGFAQTRKIAGLAYGLVQPLQWAEPKRRGVDFFDIKGDVEALVNSLLGGQCTQEESLQWNVGCHPALHPGRCAALFWRGQSLGVVGELHPRWVQAWEFPQAPIVFELSAELLLNHTVAKFHEVSKQPSVQRDLAFVVDRTVPAQQLKNSVLLACQPFMRILKSVILFDEFVSEEGATQEAKGMKSNEKSLCFRLVFQDQTSSLTEADVEPVIQQVLAQAAAMCGARLRSFTTNAG